MRRRPSLPFRAVPLALLGLLPLQVLGDDAPLRLTLRYRMKSSGGEEFTVTEKTVAWHPRRTAIIICDMWNDHWCRSAARRVAEMAGPLDKVIRASRSRGVFVIHAPSSVTSFYRDTAQRERASSAPFAATPVLLSTAPRWGTAWCWPDEKREAVLPIDDSDMGCDCAVKCKICSPERRVGGRGGLTDPC